MEWERVLRLVRGVFLVSAVAAAVGFLLIAPAFLGWNASDGAPAVVVSVGAAIMGVGTVTGGISGLILMTS